LLAQEASERQAEDDHAEAKKTTPSDARCLPVLSSGKERFILSDGP
jgi:hypothetical protein